MQYIQRLHDEQKEQDLLQFMQNNFQGFEICYRYASKHVGYLTFLKNGNEVAEFAILNFKCYSFNVDEVQARKNLCEKVRELYNNFMSETFDDYIEDLSNQSNESLTI